jgi:hypothetical protein
MPSGQDGEGYGFSKGWALFCGVEWGRLRPYMVKYRADFKIAYKFIKSCGVTAL